MIIFTVRVVSIGEFRVDWSIPGLGLAENGISYYKNTSTAIVQQ